MASIGPIPRLLHACVLPCLFLLLVFTAHAQLITFVIGTDEEQRSVQLEPVLLDTTRYVSLPKLVEELGGAYNLLPTRRVRVDYNGTTAWLTVDDVRVHALSIFSLSHPIREYESGTVIAMDDVSPFFLKAFRSRMRVSEPFQAEEATPPEATPESSPEEDAHSPESISIGPAPRPLRVIVIDPGHGGYDIGIEGVGGYQEKVLCLDVALRLKAFLDAALTQTIVLTRTEDIGLTTEERARLAVESRGDLLISIHAGGTMTPRTTGIAIYHRPPSKLALSPLGAALSRTTGREAGIGEPSRALAYSIAGALANTTSAVLRGVHAAPARLFEQADMPSVMVEVGCLTNGAEETLMQTREYREAIARGMADGVLAYMKARSALGQTADTRRPSASRFDARR